MGNGQILARVGNTVYRQHGKPRGGSCTAQTVILTRGGLGCVNCGVMVVEHVAGTNNGKENPATIESSA